MAFRTTELILSKSCMSFLALAMHLSWESRLSNKSLSALPCMRVQLLSHVRLFATPQTVALQTLQSLGIFPKEYWSGLPFSPPEDLPDPGIKPVSPAFSSIGRQILYHWPTWESPHTLNLPENLGFLVAEAEVFRKLWNSWILETDTEICNVSTTMWQINRINLRISGVSI